MEFDTLAMLIKLVLVLVILLQVVPIMVWVERRGSALMQNRLGPNRLGPLGLFQSIADVIKFFFKEDPIPGHVSPFYYVMAPWISIIPAFMTFAVIPFASGIHLGDHYVNFQVADLNVGLLYIFSVASLGVYGIIMAGWSSNNKYALLGSLRSSSQMISYELSMGLAAVGVIMVYSSLHLQDINYAQGEWFHPFGLAMITLPKWGIFVQPFGFLIFLTAVFAETNRLPFDLPEGESEIVAGYHLEYGSMKMALFFMAEYINMTTASGLLATLYFGGWHGLGWVQHFLPFTGMTMEWIRVLLEMTAFALKVTFFMWFFVWVRWTIPRFRYDQLMDLGWKVMLPLSLLNIFGTACFMYMGWI